MVGRFGVGKKERSIGSELTEAGRKQYTLGQNFFKVSIVEIWAWNLLDCAILSL